jgi:exodeoxyribonuclease VII small subunit
MARSSQTTAAAAPATPPAAAAPPAPSFEQALAELERLVSQMEAGQLPLDQLLDGYRRGSELLGFCRARLQAVEDQVKVLEEGRLEPWSAA